VVGVTTLLLKMFRKVKYPQMQYINVQIVNHSTKSNKHKDRCQTAA